MSHSENLCFKLPDNVSTLEGALIEPLSVGLHAALQGNAHIGQTAIIMGAGCIGLVTLLALKAMGVSRVVVIDVLESRLNKALELGADYVINGRQKDVLKEIMDYTGGVGCDLGMKQPVPRLQLLSSLRQQKKDLQ